MVLGMLVLGGVLSITPMGWAQVLTFPGVTIDPPGALNTWANGIAGTSAAACSERDSERDDEDRDEDHGQCDDEEGGPAAPSISVHVVGHYYDGKNFSSYQWTGNTFAPIIVPVPGVLRTIAEGINSAGHIVGYYDDSAGTHGFMLAGTTLTTIDVPGAIGTVVLGINATDQLVGYYTFDWMTYHGFLLAGGTITTLDFPGASATIATGINNAGQIVGYSGPLMLEQGWVQTGGSMLQFAVAGARSTKANGINTSGEIVGEYVDAVTLHVYGFRRGANGLVTKVDIPGSFFTKVNGISETGEIVGEYASPFQHGFKMP
jgi:uncharacterized membrane protein